MNLYQEVALSFKMVDDPCARGCMYLLLSPLSLYVHMILSLPLVWDGAKNWGEERTTANILCFIKEKTDGNVSVRSFTKKRHYVQINSKRPLFSGNSGQD